MEDVCVLAAGDPGFFGVVRSLLRVMERSRLRVIPGPSSVALAFARIGLPWDDAVVISLEERPVDEVVRVLRMARKAAVLTSAGAALPPQLLGRALVEAGLSTDLLAVCSRLGCADERVSEPDLAELATETWDPMSVVVIVGPGGLQAVGWEEAGPGGRSSPWLAPTPWGLPDVGPGDGATDGTDHERRAVALSKLAPPSSGVLWDLGGAEAGLAVDCARLCPGLTVFAVAELDEDAARITARAAPYGVAVPPWAADRRRWTPCPIPTGCHSTTPPRTCSTPCCAGSVPAGGWSPATARSTGPRRPPTGWVRSSSWGRPTGGAGAEGGCQQPSAQDPLFIVWGEGDLATPIPTGLSRLEGFRGRATPAH